MEMTKKSKYPSHSENVPMTQKMLYLVRDELKASIHSQDARFDSIDEKFKSLEHKMDSRFNELKILIEEQNARNRIVLDGLTNLFARQERIEIKFAKVFKD